MKRQRYPKHILEVTCTEKGHENNTVQFICLQESCKSQRFYCGKCSLKHSVSHGKFLVSLQDIYSNKDLSQIDNYPVNAEEKKMKKSLTQQALISSQTSTIAEIIDNMMKNLKQDIIFQLDEIQKELESCFKLEKLQTQQSINNLQYSQTSTFSIEDLRFYIDQYLNENDDYKFNSNLINWLAQSQKNQNDIKKSTKKQNLNQEMIPSIINQHQVITLNTIVYN